MNDMYSVASYTQMIDDDVRREAYVRACRRAIRPGDVVIDIGAGTGFFSVLAARLGARRVIAVEPSNAINVARAIAEAEGVADTVEFVQDLSTRLDLPERADVIVSDMRGVLPLFGEHLPSLIDARTRLLRPGGILMPATDRIFASVVEAPEVFTRHMGTGRTVIEGIDLSPATRFAANGWTRARFRPEQLVAPRVLWTELDYRTLDRSGHRSRLEWEIDRDANAHGLALWFETDLVADIGFSNAPGQPEAIYAQAFFPFQRPVSLQKGDVVAADLEARLVGGDYFWRWETRFLRPDESQIEAFNQSTFLSEPLAPVSLQKRSAAGVPVLSGEGRILAACLAGMDGGRTVGEIATGIMEAFPGRFATWNDALAFVGNVSIQWSA
jgi:type I protein arginine methyltransferase